MASNSIINYMKNLGESVKFAAIEHVKEQMPITHNFVEENKETFNEVYKSVSNIRMALPRLGRVEDNMLFKKANEAFRNIKTDLSSGKFYHPEREDPMAMLSAFGGLMGGDFMDELNAIFSGDFGDEDEEVNSDQPTRPEMMVTKGDALVASALFQSQKTSTNCIGKLMTKLHEHGNQIGRSQFTMQLAQSQKQLGITQAGFDLMTQGFNHIIEFNNQVLKTHVDNSQKFYENASRNLNESNAILKSIHEIQSSIYKQEHTKNGKLVDDPLKDAQPIDFRNLFKNGFNIQTYKQMIDSRFKNSELGMMYGLVTALPGMLQQYIDNPLHHLTKQIVSGVIGDQINYQLQQFDQTIKGAFSTGLLNLFNYGKANKNSMLGKLASMLGFKQEEKKLSQIDTSKFERGPMSWNGIAQKALTFVIPSHLARIEAALTGKGERYFDMGTGKFIDGGAAKNYEKNLKTEAVNKSTENVDKFLKSMFNNMQFNGAKGVDAEKAFRKYNRALKEAIYDYGGVGTGFDQYLLKNYKKYGIKNFGTAQFLGIQANLIPPQEKIKIAENVANAKAAKNDKLENDAAQNANFSEYLLRGSTNGMIMNQDFQKPKSGSSSINSISSPSNPPVWGIKLTELEDHRGNTVYDYLYMILNRLYQMDSLGGGKRKGKRGGPNGPTPPNVDVDDILKTTRTKRVDALDQMVKDAEKESNQKSIDFKALRERAEIFKSINEDYEAAKAILDSQGLTLDDLARANLPDDLKEAIYDAFTERQRAITEELDKYHTAHANRKRKTKTKGYSTIDDEEKVDMTNFEEMFSDENFGSEETQKLIRQFVKVGKEQNKNYMDTQMKNTSSMFDVFNGPRDRSKYHQLPDNIKEEDSILSQLIAANDAGQVMDVVRHNIDALVDSPRVVMSSIIGKANEAVYDLLFGRNVGEVDKNGNPIHGIFQKMIKEIDKQSEGIGASIKEFLKEVQKLFNEDGPLSFIGDFFKKNTGIDVTELGKSLSKKAKNLFTDIGSEAFDALKSQGRTIKQYGHEAMQEAGLVNEKGHWIFGSTYRNEKDDEEVKAKKEQEDQFMNNLAGDARGTKSHRGRGGIVSKGELIYKPDKKFGTGSLSVVKNTGYLDSNQLPIGSAVINNRDESNPYRTNASLSEDLSKEGSVRDAMVNGITRRASVESIPGYASGKNSIVKAINPETGLPMYVESKYVNDKGEVSQKKLQKMKRTDKSMRELEYNMQFSANRGVGITSDDLNEIIKASLFKDNQNSVFNRIVEDHVKKGDFGDLDSKDPKIKKDAETNKQAFEQQLANCQNIVLTMMSNKEVGKNVRIGGFESKDGKLSIGGPKREFAQSMTSQDELEKYNYTRLADIREFLEQNGFGDLMPSDEEIGKKKFSKKEGPITGLRQGMLAATGTDPMKAAELFKNYMVKEKKTAISGGVGGALLSMVLPLGGPLMGAVVGAGVNLLRKSDTFNNYMFGDEILDENGNSTGERKDNGLISKKTMDIFNKYAPDMKKYGTLGAIAGLITPFGPYGGAMIGAAASLVKNNETLNRMVFGKNGGLLNDKRKEAIKKAFPHVAMGTISMVLLGPFGLLGNAALGAGLGMLSTTEMFKKLVLGTKGRDGIRRGGLAGVIRRQIVNPLKETMEDARKYLGDWMKNKLFNPVVEGLKPLGRVARGVLEQGSKKLFSAVEDFLTGKRGKLPEFITKKMDSLFGGIRKAGGVGQWLVQSSIGKLTEKAASGVEAFGKKVEDQAIKRGLVAGYNTDEYGEALKRLGEIDENGQGTTSRGKLTVALQNLSDDDKLKMANMVSLHHQGKEGAIQKFTNAIDEEMNLTKNDIMKLSEGAKGEEANRIAKLSYDLNRDLFDKLHKVGGNEKDQDKFIEQFLNDKGISKENRGKILGLIKNAYGSYARNTSDIEEARSGRWQQGTFDAIAKKTGMSPDEIRELFEKGQFGILENTANSILDKRHMEARSNAGINYDEEAAAEGEATNGESTKLLEDSTKATDDNTRSIDYLTEQIKVLTERIAYLNGEIDSTELKYKANQQSVTDTMERDKLNSSKYQTNIDNYEDFLNNRAVDRSSTTYEDLQNRNWAGFAANASKDIGNAAYNTITGVAGIPGQMYTNTRDILKGYKTISPTGAIKGAIGGVIGTGANLLLGGPEIGFDTGAAVGSLFKAAGKIKNIAPDEVNKAGYGQEYSELKYIIENSDDEDEIEACKKQLDRILEFSKKYNEEPKGYATGGSVLGDILSKAKDAAIEGGKTATKEHWEKVKESAKEHANNLLSTNPITGNAFAKPAFGLVPDNLIGKALNASGGESGTDERGAKTKEVTTSEGDIITYVETQDGSLTRDQSKENQQAEAKLEEKRNLERRQTIAQESIAQKLGAQRGEGGEQKKEKGLLDDLLDFMKTPFKWLGGAISGAAKMLGGFLMTTILKPFKDGLVKMAKGVGSWVMKGVGKVGGFLKGLIPKAVSGIAGGIMNLLKKNKVIGAALGIGGALLGKKVYDATDTDEGYKEEVEGYNSQRNGLGAMSPQEQKIASEMASQEKDPEEITETLRMRRKEMAAKGEKDEVKGDKAEEKFGLAKTLAPWVTGAVGSLIGRRFGHRNAGFILGSTVGDTAQDIMNGQRPSLGSTVWNLGENYVTSKAIDYLGNKIKGDYRSGRDAAIAEREAAEAAKNTPKERKFRKFSGGTLTRVPNTPPPQATTEAPGILDKAKKWFGGKVDTAKKWIGEKAASGTNTLTKAAETVSKEGELASKAETLTNKAKDLLESFKKGVTKILPKGAGEGLSKICNTLLEKIKPDIIKKYLPKLGKFLGGGLLGGPVVMNALGVYWAGKAFYEGYQKSMVCEVFGVKEDQVTTAMQIISGIVHGLIAFNPLISILVDLLLGGTKGLLRLAVKYIGPIVGLDENLIKSTANAEQAEENAEKDSENPESPDEIKENLTTSDTSFDTKKNVSSITTTAGAPTTNINSEITNEEMESTRQALSSKISDIISRIQINISKYISGAIREALATFSIKLVQEVTKNQAFTQGIAKLKTTAGNGSAISAYIMNYNPSSVKIITSYIAGTANSDKVLGLPIGSATQGMKEISGIITAIMTSMPFITGFISEKELKSIVIDYIGRAAGVSKQDIDRVKKNFEQKEKKDTSISNANTEDRNKVAQGGRSKINSSLDMNKIYSNGPESGATKVASDIGKATETKSTWQSIKDTASSAWEGAKSVASNVWEGAKNVGSSIWEGAKNLGSKAWNAAFGGSKYGRSSLFGTIGGIFKGFTSNTLCNMSDLANAGFRFAQMLSGPGGFVSSGIQMSYDTAKYIQEKLDNGEITLDQVKKAIESGEENIFSAGVGLGKYGRSKGLFLQSDPRFGDRKQENCLSFALANLEKNKYGGNVTPIDFMKEAQRSGDKVENDGTKPEFVQKAMSRRGFDVKYVSKGEAKSKMMTDPNASLILEGTDSRGVNPRTPFAGKHYVAVAHMSKDGKGMKVMDSQPDTSRGSSIYNTDEVLNHSGKVIALTPKKNGGSKSIISKLYNYARSKFGKSKYGKGTAEENRDFIWNWLRDANKGGLNNAAAAGIMGSMQQESGFEPRINQGSMALTEDAPPPSGEGQNGYGLCQWTGSRTKKLIEYAASKGKHSGDLETQLEFMMQEAVDRGVWSKMAAATDPTEASKIWTTEYEGCGVVGSRHKFAKEIFDTNGKGSIGVSTYRGGGGSNGSSNSNKPLGFFGAIAKLLSALNPFSFDFSKGSQGLIDAARNFKNDIRGGGSSGGAGASGGKVDVPAQGNAAEAMRDAIGMEITSPYGPRELMGHSFHHGVDYGAPEGTKIPALMNATVDDVGTENGYGNYVVLKDKNNHYHIAAHLSDNSLVSRGSQVSKGDIIGISGATGQGTGPHLHYGIYTNPNCAGGDGAVDPSGYSINGLGKYGMGKQITPIFSSNGNIGYKDEENGLKNAIHYGQNKNLNLFGTGRATLAQAEQILKQQEMDKAEAEKRKAMNQTIETIDEDVAKQKQEEVANKEPSEEAKRRSKMHTTNMQIDKDSDKLWTAPNGLRYSKNDVEYLKKNGYNQEQAFWQLARCEKYTKPVTEAEIKESQKDKYKESNSVKQVQKTGTTSTPSTSSTGNGLVDRLMGKVNDFLSRNPAFSQMMTFLFGTNPFANLFGSSGGTTGGGSFGGSVPPSEYATKILQEARSHIGKPYSMAAGTGPNSYDCSGHAQTSYAAAGLQVPRTSDDQYEFFKGKNALVNIEQSQPGDMIFFENTYQTETTNNNGITHVGIVSVGGNTSSLKMIHASSSKGVIECGISSWHQDHLPSGRPCIGSLSLAFGGAKKDDDKVEDKNEAQKYNVDELAPNGKKYDPEHVKYLMDNGYSKEEAVEELSKNEKYAKFDENPSKVTLTNTGTYLDNLFKKSGYGSNNTPEITTDDIPTVDNNNGMTPTYTGTGSYLDNLTKQAGQSKFGKGKIDPFAVGGGFGGALTKTTNKSSNPFAEALSNIQSTDDGFGDFISNIQNMIHQEEQSKKSDSLSSINGFGNVISDIQNTVDTISSRNSNITGDNGSVVPTTSEEIPNVVSTPTHSTVSKPAPSAVVTENNTSNTELASMIQAQNRTNELLGAILAVVQAAANSVANNSNSKDSGKDLATGLGGPIKAILSTLGGGSSFGMGDKFLGNMGNRNNSQGDIGSIMNAMSAIVNR